MVTIHAPAALPRASSAMRSWISRIDRTFPSDGNMPRSASRSMCAWPSMRPGMTVLRSRSRTRVVGAACCAIAASGPTAMMRSPAIAMALAIVEPASTVITLAFRRMRSAGRDAGAAGTDGWAAAGATKPLANGATAAPAAPAFRKSRRGNVLLVIGGTSARKLRPSGLGFLDTFRTLCVDPKEEIRSIFEELRAR